MWSEHLAILKAEVDMEIFFCGVGSREGAGDTLRVAFLEEYQCFLSFDLKSSLIIMRVCNIIN